MVLGHCHWRATEIVSSVKLFVFCKTVILFNKSVCLPGMMSFISEFCLSEMVPVPLVLNYFMSSNFHGCLVR